MEEYKTINNAISKLLDKEKRTLIKNIVTYINENNIRVITEELLLNNCLVIKEKKVIKRKVRQKLQFDENKYVSLSSKKPRKGSAVEKRVNLYQEMMLVKNAIEIIKNEGGTKGFKYDIDHGFITLVDKVEPEPEPEPEPEVESEPEPEPEPEVEPEPEPEPEVEPEPEPEKEDLLFIKKNIESKEEDESLSNYGKSMMQKVRENKLKEMKEKKCLKSRLVEISIEQVDFLAYETTLNNDNLKNRSDAEKALEAGLALYKFNEIHNNYDKYKSKYGIVIEDIKVTDMELVLDMAIEELELNGTDDELDFEN